MHILDAIQDIPSAFFGSESFNDILLVLIESLGVVLLVLIESLGVELLISQQSLVSISIWTSLKKKILTSIQFDLLYNTFYHYLVLLPF